MPYLNFRAGSSGTVSSITQRDITLDFSSPVRVRQGVLGDYFIEVGGGGVGVSRTPAPTGTGSTRRHGAMINPTDFNKQGFDGRFNTTYDETTSFADGGTVNQGDSLICCVSRNPESDLAGLGSNPRGMESCEIFTFVDTLPPATAFRPPACGTSKPIITTDDVNYGLMPGLTEAFDHTASSQPLNITNPKTGMTRPWMDRCGGFTEINLSGLVPDDYQEWYPRDNAVNLNRLAVYSLFNTANAQTIANRIIQFGIDQKGVASQSNWTWGNLGAGFGVGRMLPFLYAGWLLEDPDFTDIVANAGPSSPKFGEDFSYYRSTTPYSGYSAGYPSKPWASGPNYPMMGDNNGGSPPYSDNHSTRDPNGKYIACSGVDSDAGFEEFGLSYQAVDGGNDVMARAGSYLFAQGLGMAGCYIWSAITNQLSNWGNPAAVEFMEWWMHDVNLALDVTKDKGSAFQRDVYQYGGTGDEVHKNLYEDMIA